MPSYGLKFWVNLVTIVIGLRCGFRKEYFCDSQMCHNDHFICLHLFIVIMFLHWLYFFTIALYCHLLYAVPQRTFLRNLTREKLNSSSCFGFRAVPIINGFSLACVRPLHQIS